MPETALGGESPGERYKTGYRDIFRACRRIEPGCGEERRHVDAERAEALAQHFAPLPEGGLSYCFEEAALAWQR